MTAAADVDRWSERDRSWQAWAVRLVEADANRSADTHLLSVPLPCDWGTDLYLKDESTHPTGSLKHRLARSLFLYALCNGWLTEGSPVVEASSGSTAISEAYFSRMLGLPFIAVMPRTTSPEKIVLIEQQGGRCHLVDDPSSIYDESRRLAAGLGGHYMDQFTHAERATDWRGNNNIAESIFEQMRLERHSEPRWIVVGAGTGAPARPSADTCATAAMPPGSASSTRRIRRSSRVGPMISRICAPTSDPGSKGSAGPGSSPASSRASSTA